MNIQKRDLEGRVALVTGASRRIGRAVALGLAQQGAAVVVHARSSRDEVEAVAAEIRAAGGKALAVLGDVTLESDVERIFQEARDGLGEITILINNAAIRGERGFLEMTLEDWRQIHSVILEGAFLCSREALRGMVNAGGGTIVNIGGVTAHVGAKARAHVSAAKAGIVGLTKALALEFADRGVTVNCVAPGKIGGPRSASAGASPDMGAGPIVGRPGEVDEAAYMVVSLCRPGARFTTGQTVHVSGGMYMP
jgi:3-oxoacyl-[acyl-carrier protein] reductase